MAHTTNPLALLFPGQGVGADGVAELVRAERPDLHELACDLVGVDPFARISEGTRFAQPAIYCASIAGLDRLGRPAGAVYAGHSLGELAALAGAGALDDLDGLRLAAHRGRLMDEATAAAPTGMLAVRGDREAAAELARGAGLALANENSPSQFVLSGSEENLDRAVGNARAAGMRAKRLSVAGAFHSPYMQSAVDPFRKLLDATEFRSGRAIVVSGVTAEPFGTDPAELLARALVEPVRWLDVMRSIHGGGVRRYLDVGPGQVLAKLVRQTLDDAEVVTEPTAVGAHV